MNKGCQASAELGQTEYEFFQQMLSNPNILICCGPLTQIGFTGPSLSAFKAALTRMDLDPKYLDLYDHEVLDSGHLSYFMCARHWIHHARTIGSVAISVNNKNWEQLAYFIFRVTCLTNKWDYKEVLNFNKTAEAIRVKKEE